MIDFSETLTLYIDDSFSLSCISALPRLMILTSALDH